MLSLAGCGNGTGSVPIGGKEPGTGDSGGPVSDTAPPHFDSDSFVPSGPTAAADSSAGDTANPCPDPFVDGAVLEDIAFLDEAPRELETLTGEGLDARYVHDLSSLDDATLITPNERFFIRTGTPDTLPSSESWRSS